MKKFLLQTMITFSIILSYSLLSSQETSAADENLTETRTVVVHHLDNFNVPIKEADVYTGEIGEVINIIPASSPYFTTNTANLSTYTMSEDNEQVVTLRYTNRRFQAANTYMSMFFDTTYTYTGYINSEYGGNLAYFNQVNDEAARAIYTMSFKNNGLNENMISFEIDFPTGSKFSLSDKMNTKLFVQTNTLQVLPLSMMYSDYLDGKVDFEKTDVQTEFWVSIDNGEHYFTYETLSEEQKESVTNVVGRLFFSQAIFDDTNQRGYLVAELPIHLVENHLSTEELSGEMPISGWSYKNNTLTKTIQLDTKFYINNPTISGYIKENQEKNWETATSLANHTVRLLSIDSDENEQVISETKSNHEGYYAFHHEIQSFENIKVEVLDAQNKIVYFYFIDAETELPNFIETDFISVGNLPNIVVNTTNRIYNWYQQTNDNSFAKSSQSLNFLFVQEEVPQPQQYTVTYTDGTGLQTFFQDQSFQVLSNEPTPAFVGELDIEGYTFVSWSPTLSDTVTENITYAAVWEKATPEESVSETSDFETSDSLIETSNFGASASSETSTSESANSSTTASSTEPAACDPSTTKIKVKLAKNQATDNTKLPTTGESNIHGQIGYLLLGTCLIYLSICLYLSQRKQFN